MTTNYRSSGVDIQAGDDLVSWLQASAHSKSDKNNIAGIGGFAAISRFQFPHMKKPCIVTSTDGVGTKVKLASHFGVYAGVGQDLVAMCVNDLITCGAEPWLFLDYYASGRLNLENAKEFLGGVRAACAESGCSLIGGETAEMPGVYHDNDFDCAGFAIGVVDEDEILGAARVGAGDVVLGISSSGFHSNGFSLIRKVFEKDLDAWREQLLRPTALYVKLARKLRQQNLAHAMANITGSGMENLPRVLPADMEVVLERWPLPVPFLEILKRTGMSEVELLTTLNCGVGFAVVCAPEHESDARNIILSEGFSVIPLGRVDAGAFQGEARVNFKKWGVPPQEAR